MSLLLSKSRPPVSSPSHLWVYLWYIFLYKTSCYALSFVFAPIPRALSRFCWHILISFLLSSSHPSSSQFSCLSASNMKNLIISGSLLATFGRVSAYQANQSHYTLLRTREGNIKQRTTTINKDKIRYQHQGLQ